MTKFFQKVLIVVGLASTSLYGNYYYDDCCCDPMGCGFLVGGYGSFHTFYFHSKDVVNSPGGSFPEKNQFEYDLIQRAPGGGGYIGYGMPFCDCFSLALKAGVTGCASEAEHAFHEAENSDENFLNELRVRYLVDLSFQAGTQVTECFMAYFTFGASYVDFKQTYTIIDNDGSNPTLDKVDKDHNEWGFVFGAGTEVAITRCINAFVQYDWHSYPLSVSTVQAFTNDGGNDNVESRVTRLHGGGFSAGLSFSF